MIQIRENSKFLSSFYSVLGALAWAVSLVVAGIVSIPSLLPAVRDLGIATTVAALGSFLLTRFLWRRPLFRRILGMPDLSGRWEGWSYPNLTKEWRPTAHEIRQQAYEITANAWGPAKEVSNNNWTKKSTRCIMRRWISSL